jgi:hypothetical protein
MKTTVAECEIRIRVKDGKAVRVRIMEPDRDGKYVELARPWCAQDLANYRKARQVMGLLASGISDAQDIMEKANAPHGLRRNAAANSRAASWTERRRNRRRP